MGIKNYFTFISKYYPECIKDKWLDSYDCVFLDINHCLHRIIHTSIDVSDIYLKLERLIINILQNLNPIYKVIIASDGPAPMAKILLQKKRRLDDVMKSDNINYDLSSLNFTPGTIFMKELLNKIQNLVIKIKLLFNVEVELDMDTPDEAEIKIKRIMWNISKKFPEYTQCVISDDGDVLSMSSNFDNIHNIYVMRKNKQEINIINMGILIDKHTDKYGCGLNPGYDFMALNIMLGNDYLPKVHYVDFDKIWTGYKFSIDCGNDGLVLKTSNENMIYINQVFLLDVLTGIVMNMNKRFLNEFYVKLYNSSICDDYIDGMLWCLDMYNNGICKQYDYIYNHNHKSPPHCSGLYLQLLRRDKMIKPISNTSKPLNNELYSIILIPKKAKHMIEKKYHNLIDNKEFEILYKDEHCKDCERLINDIKQLEKKNLIPSISQSVKCELNKAKLRLKLHNNNYNHNQLTSEKIYELQKIFDKSFNFF